MPYPLPLTRTEAYLAYKAGVAQLSDLKPSLAIPRNGIDAWLAYWTGLSFAYPVKNVGKNILSSSWETGAYSESTGEKTGATGYRTTDKIAVKPNTAYIVSRNSSGLAINIGLYKNDGTFITRLYANADASFSTTSDTAYITLWRGSSGGIDKMMLEEGESISQYAPYTGEPLILQEEEAYIAYLCGVINEYPEKCLHRVGAYLRYLISARWGRPDHPLNREELYLSLIKTQFIPSGDPSSDITIEGTCKAPFIDVKMYGDTFQQSYTGKNLVATTRIAPQTQNGVTCTWDGASFTLNGTSTASTDFYGRGWWGATSNPIALPAGTYTFSLRKSDGSLATGANFSIDCYHGTTHIIGIYRGQSGAGFSTVTFDSDTQYSVLYISLLSGKTYNNEKFYIQLEKSDSPTTWEPYTNGQPSPSPDYPQQIQTVTGEQVVEIVGKNLFDISKANMMVARLNSSGEITLDITNRLCTRGYIGVKPSTTYTFNALPETSGKTLQAYIVGYSESGSGTAIGNYPTNAWYSFPITFTTGSNCRFIRISYRYSDDSTMATTSAINQQLELGSATAYAPYSKQTYPINLGKNLYNGSIYKTDCILSATGSEVYSEGAVITEQMEVEPNTVYTASAIWKSSGMVDTYIRIGVYDASMGWIVRYSGEPDKITFTTPANARYIRLSYYRARTDSVQLELGSTATSYAPYSTPIELCNIGDYQDYIYKSGDKWFKHSDIGKITLDGSQDITTLGDGAGGIKRFRYANETIRNISTSKRGVYCDIYQGMQYNGASYVPNSIAQWESQNMFAITTASTTYSVNDFKAALSSNPATIYYALATPTDTEITNQNLIDQLNALKQGGAEEGTTYIKVSATEPNLPGLLYVEAPKYE